MLGTHPHTHWLIYTQLKVQHKQPFCWPHSKRLPSLSGPPPGIFVDNFWIKISNLAICWARRAFMILCNFSQNFLIIPHYNSIHWTILPPHPPLPPPQSQWLICFPPVGRLLWYLLFCVWMISLAGPIRATAWVGTPPSPQQHTLYCEVLQLREPWGCFH